MKEKKYEDVSKYYDSVAKDYHTQYERETLFDISKEYPANYFRMQLLLNSFISKGIKRVVEVGVGEGTPLKTLADAGLDVSGFDISMEMVKKAKQNMKGFGLDPDKVFWADIQDPITYAPVLKQGQFDGLLAMGVMPHVANDDVVMENIKSLVRPGGTVFIEFRNKLFSLFTFNRHTMEFILDDLLKGVDEDLRSAVEADLKTRLRMDVPPLRDFDKIPARFHNPFEVIELFKKHSFTNIKPLWYHYHPAMPYLSSDNPDLFRKESIKLEHDPSGWKGFFLCSAFVIEADKT